MVTMRRVNRLLCIVICFTLSAGASADANAQQPNIVLIISDYMGYHDTEPYGAEDVRTPSLARLASAGVTMTDFYAAAPVCGPARAALYTGQYPARIGFEKNIRKEQSPLTRQLYWRADLYDFGKQPAIQDGRWKYVRHGNTQFLFDLNADLSERNNLFYEHTEVVNRLRADLDAWQESL